jgi:hypothetical protein
MQYPKPILPTVYFKPFDYIFLCIIYNLIFCGTFPIHKQNQFTAVEQKFFTLLELLKYVSHFPFHKLSTSNSSFAGSL